ncbi:helix-turn-helix transcriptional regulator [Ferrovibrio sp.]|uniref:helix-turn-helix transcriptional regulator n=1 Tax=Ferrovibrio sp. TaxID=1917215 RepID=UPI0035135492
MDLRQFSALVEGLYDAALNPEGWHNVAPEMARAFQSGSCAIQLRELASGQTVILSHTDNYDAKALADYEAHFYATDMYVDGALKLGFGIPVLGNQLVDDSVLLNSELYADWCKGIGVFHLAGGMLAVDSSAMAGIGIHRAYGARGYSEDDRQTVGLLLPHLTRALQMYRRLHGLEQRGGIGLAALEALAVGVMVVNPAGRLLFSNTVAEKLLRKGQGITVSHGQLRAQFNDRDPMLQQTIREAVAGFSGRSSHAGMLVMPRRDGLPLSLLVCPAPGYRVGTDRLQAAAIIFVNNPDDRITPTEAALTAQFRLTPAEARLTAALLDGEHADDYAVRTGLSPHTVKTQLKAVFAKTGCGRQADLVRTVLSNPILRMCRQG